MTRHVCQPTYMATPTACATCGRTIEETMHLIWILLAVLLAVAIIKLVLR